MSESEVIFNYLGQIDQVLTSERALRPSRRGTGRLRHSDGMREYLLDVNAAVVHGVLHVTWTYSRHVHREETIASLAERCWMTSAEGIFTAGDMQRGQSLIVWAIADGRHAAAAVDSYLMGESGLSAIA
jgi:non-ribosomal peptide synthase protein (TIGR01720 family)